jgi:2-hydroxychromene-2-carboxylate isomerase
VAEIDAYLDLTCPYSYLAFLRVQEVAIRNGATVNWCPVLVDRVLATENPSLVPQRLAALETKAAWQRQDIELWSRYWGIAINLPVEWPYTAEAATCGALLALDRGNGSAYMETAFRLVFADDKSLLDPECFGMLATAADIEVNEFSVAIQDTALQQRLRNHEAELIRRGGFGAPTMFVGENMYFGNDRMPLVEWDVGPVSDASFVVPGQHGQVS